MRPSTHAGSLAGALLLCLGGACGLATDESAPRGVLPRGIETDAPRNPCTDPDRTGVKLAPPTSGVYHGVFLPSTPGTPVSDAQIGAFQDQAGRRVAWVYFDHPFGHDGALDLRFPAEAVQTIWSRGAVPFIRFMPWTTHTQYQEDPVVHLRELVDTTRFDGPLQDWLRAARDSRIPLVVQFGVEVNGKWFPWNGHWNGAGATSWRDPSWPDGPEAFRLAYRKLVTLARQNNAWNITWAFHVSHWPDPAESTSPWNQMRYYYPGDDYIDWLGLSVYGEMRPYGLPSEWHGFRELLGQTNWQLTGGLSPYEELSRVTASATKPLAIFETAVTEDPAAGDKGSWIAETYGAIADGSFPRLRGASWWQERWDNDPPMGPSEMLIGSSPGSLAAYRAQVAGGGYRSTPRFRCTRQALP